MSAFKPLQPDQLWLSFTNPDAIHAPNVDLFEADLDASLFGVDQSQLQFLDFNFNSEPFHLVRNSNVNDAPSTITLSSESTYDDSSLYSYPRSPTYSTVDSVYSKDLQMSFANFNVDSSDHPAVAAPQPISCTPNSIHLLDDTDSDPNSFGELPISPYDSSSSRSSSFIDFDGQQSINTTPTEFFLQANQHAVSSIPAAQRIPSAGTQNISPINMIHPIPRLTVQMSESPNTAESSMSPQDGRRKYQCPSCPRAFARAYNLKTHMATHDPQRLKPFTCPHQSCGRAFSRKHDLGRHLIAIHHDSPDSKKIGVENGHRQWCEHCGKGWTNASSACECET